MDYKVFDAALERTAKTWQIYAKTACILALTLVIDALSGSKFIEGKAPITLFNFTIVREALSVTYGVLFSLFVATVFLQSRLLNTRLSAFDSARSGLGSVLDGWFLSPFSRFWYLRVLFWILFIGGFAWLLAFSCIHLFNRLPPDPLRMTQAMYQGIGVIDLVLLFVCIPLGVGTYRYLREVRSTLSACENPD